MAKRKVSVGKYRALHRSSTPDGVFAILALDHQDALRTVLRPDTPMDISDDELVAFKREVVEMLVFKCSGVLLDPVFGAGQAVQANSINRVGLIVELEKADYEMNPLPCIVELRTDWDVAKIKRMSADGVKLFFYYNPDDTDIAMQQRAIVRQVVEQCAIHDIPFYAEPIIYPFLDVADSDGYREDRTRLVIESAAHIAELGVDVLKLEFPIDIERYPDEEDWLHACEQLSEAIDCPWVLLSGGVDFETFHRQVGIACRGGASGFIAGRAIWGEACTVDEQERYQWLDITGRGRMTSLESFASILATKWTDLIECVPVSTKWYRTYEGDA